MRIHRVAIALLVLLLFCPWPVAEGRPAAAQASHAAGVRALGYGYTGASVTDSLAIFDLGTWTLSGTLSLLPEGNYPYDATIRPDGSEVWITGASGDGVVVVDTASNQVTHRIMAGSYTIGVAFRTDGALAFVSARDSGDVSVIDTATYAVVDTIPIPTYYLGAGNLAINPCSDALYVVDYYDDSLIVVDTAALTVTDVLRNVGTSLWQLVVHPQGNYLYITDRGQDNVHVLDTATLGQVTTIPVGDDPWGIDIAPDGALIYVTNEDSHDVTAIDATSNSVITTIALPHGNGSDPRDVDFDAAGAYAYVPSGDVSGDDEVYVLDAATHSVAGRIVVAPAANPNVVAVAPQWGAPVASFVSNSPAELGQMARFTDTSAFGPTAWAWDFGDGTGHSNEQHPTYMYTSSGVFTVTLTASNTCTSATAAGHFEVLAPPCQPVETAAISGPVELVVDQVGLYSATYAPPTATQPVSITWSNGTPGATAAYSWTVPGTYTVTATVSNPCALVPAGLTVTVVPACESVQTAAISGPVGLVVGQVGLYSATYAPPTATEPVSITWNNGAEGATVAYSWTVPGDYTVAISVTNPCGAAGAALVVSVQALPVQHRIYLPLVVRG